MKADPGSLTAVLGLARALDPDLQRDRLRADLGGPDLKANRETHRAMARSTDLPAATALLLAQVLIQANDTTATIAILQEAAMQHPQEPWIAYELGNRLRQQSRSRKDEAICYDEAIRYYSVARALRPELAYQLGGTLRESGRLREAVVVVRDLVRRRPEAARFRMELAVALRDQGEVAEADAILNEAVDLARRAVQLRPEDGGSHHDLGLVLAMQGRRAEAFAEYREIARLMPDIAGVHWNLGHSLLYMGKISEALAEFRVGLRLDPDDHDFREQVQKCERLVQLDHRLPSILKGTDHPANADERIELARLCCHKGFFRTSAGFYAEAFAEKPALAEDLSSDARYDAACSAALAAVGQSKDDPLPAESTRVALRQQALAWLRNDLAAWAKVQKEGRSEVRRKVVRTLQDWKEDTDLASLRDESELAKLPEAERNTCRKLWAEVDERLKQISGSAKPDK
jgi:tetratricopeptide (TPR) repeat protein